MRLFVALGLPEAVRARAWRATAPLREAGLPVRWVGAERLHLTLEFLGETDRGRLEEVEAALERVARGFGPLELRLGGVGAFPSARRPRVLWLGVVGPAALRELQSAAEASLAELGFEPERRPFHAHVTLGRARRRSGRRAFEGWERLADGIVPEAEFRVDVVDLMESVLRPDGARYSIVSSFRLAGADGSETREGR